MNLVIYLPKKKIVIYYNIFYIKNIPKINYIIYKIFLISVLFRDSVHTDI